MQHKPDKQRELGHVKCKPVAARPPACTSPPASLTATSRRARMSREKTSRKERKTKTTFIFQHGAAAVSHGGRADGLWVHRRPCPVLAYHAPAGLAGFFPFPLFPFFFLSSSSFFLFSFLLFSFLSFFCLFVCLLKVECNKAGARNFVENKDRRKNESGQGNIEKEEKEEGGVACVKELAVSWFATFFFSFLEPIQ